ncbi:hypothetical protein Q0812_01365 [Brevundimonas sp. 2R-24]|uniref:Uncharacterized protein n=1 Tax=Peiella sedimenti TaxID=3061083 RepID=A0ABT8SI69_9CAUL|nr:hypothetical protein [Caulobacteraceae bacterium XZ-24]
MLSLLAAALLAQPAPTISEADLATVPLQLEACVNYALGQRTAQEAHAFLVERGFSNIPEGAELRAGRRRGSSDYYMTIFGRGSEGGEPRRVCTIFVSAWDHAAVDSYLSAHPFEVDGLVSVPGSRGVQYERDGQPIIGIGLPRGDGTPAFFAVMQMTPGP